MKISFTTLGCPDWDLDTICRRGREYGYEGVDFRGLQETMDITQLPAFTSGAAQTRRQLADAGMEVSGISSSIRVCVPEKCRGERRGGAALDPGGQCVGLRVHPGFWRRRLQDLFQGAAS